MTKLIQVELLDAEALGRLEELVQLRMIRLKPGSNAENPFSAIISRLRKKAERLPVLSLDDITEAVELVRAQQQISHAANKSHS